MTRRRRGGLGEQRSSFGLSFVDTISGGFGAAFFLFLIFASLPIDDAGRERGGGSRFLEIWLSWQDQNAVAEMRLKHSATGEIRLTGGLISEDSATGQLSAQAEGMSFWRAATATGFSWFGETVMASQDPSSPDRAVRFRFVDFCGGTLQVDATVHGRSDGGLWLQETSAAETLARIEVVVSTGEGERKTLKNLDTSLTRGSRQFQPIYLTEEGSQEVQTEISLGETPEDFSWCAE